MFRIWKKKKKTNAINILVSTEEADVSIMNYLHVNDGKDDDDYDNCSKAVVTQL